MNIYEEDHWYTITVLYSDGRIVYDITCKCDDLESVDDIVTATLLQVCPSALAISLEKNW